MKNNVKRHEVVQPEDQLIKLIPLTKGQNAIVDASDYKWLMQWNWLAARAGDRFYAARAVRINGKARFLYMHRFILGLDLDDPRVGDHIEIVATLDNRRSNIRIATESQNQQHSLRHLDEDKGIRVRGKKWYARIKLNNREIYLGCFSEKSFAQAAYRDAAKQYHGEFSVTV